MKQPYKIIFFLLLGIIVIGYGYTIITGNDSDIIDTIVTVVTMIILSAGYTGAIWSLCIEYPKWKPLIIFLAIAIVTGIAALIVFNNN